MRGHEKTGQSARFFMPVVGIAFRREGLPGVIWGNAFRYYKRKRGEAPGRGNIAGWRLGIKFYTMHDEKEIRWIGSSYDDILEFPPTARRQAGFQLSRIQAGLDPHDWKPFDDVGAGVREVRIRDGNGIYRVMYVAKFEGAIYVLHCFRKKTQATSNQDKQIAANRYRAIVREAKEPK